MPGRISLEQSRRVFEWTVAATLILKLWLAIWFPITSDEAFFFQWALFPNWGYYDHPPMIGWWLWVLSQFSHAPWVIRLATVLLTTVIAVGVVKVARHVLPEGQESRAWLAGAVYLSLPVSWFGVFVTTDTPLIFFCGLTVWVYLLAWQRNSALLMVLAGVLAGLAFLSKYFAVLLGFALVVHLLATGRFKLLGALVLGGLPVAMVNVAYNAYNCWNNIMFNLVNRHDDAQLGWKTVATYLGMMVYLLTPWVVWALWKGRAEWKRQSALVAALWIPLGLFLLISLEKTVGMHWVLSFLPIAFVLLALGVQESKLLAFVRFNAWLALPHIALFAALMHANPSIWPESFRDDVIFHRQGGDIVRQLSEDLPAGGTLATIAYSPAALMSYHAGRTVPVFGPGKYHARNDDVFVDWRQMDGKPIRIVAKAKPIDPASYAPYFKSTKVSTRVVDGVSFTVVDGERFNYPRFREVVLREAVEKYYRIPKGLPVLDCPFGRKYGFEAECRIGDWGVLNRFKAAQAGQP